jgi:putative ABC transport system substrate-binding protein
MRRREFITCLGGAVAWPLAVNAQQPAMPVVGFLNDGLPRPNAGFVAAFRQGLAEAGYVEGQNVAIEFRWADNHLERLPALAADLVRRPVAVIVATGPTASGLAAKAATSTIPIVLASGLDPVKYGLVASLNRPGGNVTGATFISTELTGKRLEMLREMVPQATTVAYLSGGSSLLSFEEEESHIVVAARAVGQQVVSLEARSDRDFEAAFATLVQRRAEALVVGVAPLLFYNLNEILALAARHRIPAIYPGPLWAFRGGLMSYGASIAEGYRQVGIYTGRILKGEKPSDLPVVQPTKFDLVINLKTAKALGLEIPPTLLAIVDEVIE